MTDSGSEGLGFESQRDHIFTLLSFTIGLLDDEQAFSLGFSRTTVKGIDAFYLLTSGFLRVDRRADDLIF